MLLLLLTASTFFTQAQKVTGIAKDENGSPLVGTTVSLHRAVDSVVIKLAVSKENGGYAFSGISEGNYKVSASNVGYKTVFSAVFSVGASEVIVPELILSKLATALSNVTVTATKPMVEVKADRTILNVEGTINATGSNALELLRKSPGVSLDKDENISLAGKNGVQVYIDGRVTPLSGTDLAIYLRTLQSSQIEAIELITNPSAKYDAAGNAGIINIRLKKNKSFGTNGSVNAGWNIGTYAKYNGGGSLNYRNKKINIFSNYSFNDGPNQQSLNINRTVLDSLFDQHGTIRMVGNANNFKVGADYFLDKKNTLGIIVNGTLSDPTMTNYSHTVISNTTTNTVDRILIADNSSTLKRHNTNVNLNYSYNDPRGTSLIVNADHGFYKMGNDQYQPNHYYDPSGQLLLGSTIYHMLSPAEININSIKADYERNFIKGKLSFGAKSAFVKTDNNFQRYNVEGSNEELDKDRSNHFVYKENINAAYVNLNKPINKKWGAQVGLRLENTNATGNQVTTGEEFNRHYTQLFPTGYLQYQPNKKNTYVLNYGRRIRRPDYQSLNPFINFIDRYTYSRGNPNLKPQFSHNVELSHSYQSFLTTTLNYSRTTDIIQNVLEQIEEKN